MFERPSRRVARAQWPGPPKPWRDGELSQLRLRTTRAVPALARNIRRRTQRKPHLARRQAGLESFRGRALTEWREHEVAHQAAPIGLTELVSDRSKELAAGHRVYPNTAVA